MGAEESSGGRESSGGGESNSYLDEKGVSNNKDHRAISDKLDDEYFNDHPRQRAAVHCAYHAVVGTEKLVCGNWEGCKAEFVRSGQQLERTRKPSPQKK